MQLTDCFTQILAYTGYLVGNMNGSRPAYSAVRKDYERLFARAEEHAREAGVPPQEYEKALFGVCAWVDEAILSSSWEGRTNWLGQELQRFYFHTTSAGETFFARLEQLPGNETNVRQVYATCLALGFRGRYFSEKDDPMLRELLTRQVTQIVPGEPLASITQPGEWLFPDAYPAPSARKRKRLRRFPFLSLLFVLSTAIFLGGLFVAYKGILDGMVRSIFSALGIM
jgi:type VI secretion system protein ImpK